jgi:hypothetical protein
MCVRGLKKRVKVYFKKVTQTVLTAHITTLPAVCVILRVMNYYGHEWAYGHIY